MCQMKASSLVTGRCLFGSLMCTIARVLQFAPKHIHPLPRKRKKCKGVQKYSPRMKDSISRGVKNATLYRHSCFLVESQTIRAG